MAAEVANPANLARLFSNVTDAHQLAFVLNQALALDLAENPKH